MAYTTLAELKPYLNIVTDDADALLTAAIATAQAVIEAPPPLGTGRVFEAAQDATNYYDAPTHRRLDLAPHDLCQITSVTNGDGTVINPAYYTTDPRGVPPYRAIILKAGAPVAWTYDTYREGAIAVTGRFAYSVTPPAHVQHLALRLAAWLYRQAANSTSDQAVQTEVGIVLPTRLPADIALMLRALRPIL